MLTLASEVEVPANALLGGARADPAAALVVAAVALKEGRDTWRGDACCTVPAPDRAACACCA